MEHAKLWKRILNEGIDILPPFDERDEDLVKQVIIATSIVFPDIDNNGLVETHESQTGSALPVEMISRPVDLKTYKYCCIPAEQCWIERRHLNPDHPLIVGHLFNSKKIPEGYSVELKEISERVKSFGRPILNGVCYFKFDRDGSYVPDSISYIVPQISEEFHEYHFGAGSIKLMILGMMADALDELMLLSAKNISPVPIQTDDKQARRAAKRHGGNPADYRYHVLEIIPRGSKAGTRGEPLGVMPRHFCIGHWAEYGPQFGKGLLFGKYEGRFFITPHMRGDKKNGIVEKDYEIPASATA